MAERKALGPWLLLVVVLLVAAPPKKELAESGL